MPRKSKLPVARRIGLEAQPLCHVEWVPRESLHSNLYNPNRVPPPELDLLKVSILEDGWTQPIVARSSGEIVDGFHRWTVSADPQIAAMTGGLVPVVRLADDTPLEQQMAATVRHNRARGAHVVTLMAEMVRHLLEEEGLSYEQVMARLGMEWEEVDRLYDRGGMLKRGRSGAFSPGWVPE